MTATSITCPDCGRTSHHPDDVKNGYCGNCHWWTSHPVLAPFRSAYHELQQSGPSQVRMKIRMAIMRKDADRLTALAGAMGCLNRCEEYERVATEETAAAPHDVQHFWLSEPCNCTRVLN